MKRFVLIDFAKENRHGYRVDEQTFTMTSFEQNPVLLFMHERGQVLGRWTDFERTGRTITAVPVFDEKDPAAAVLKGKVERGFIKAASVRFDHRPAEIKKDVLYHGEVIEVSLVDIPAYRETLALENSFYYNTINGLVIDMKEGTEKKPGDGTNDPLSEPNEKERRNNLEKENACLKSAMAARILQAEGHAKDEVRQKAYLSLSVDELVQLDRQAQPGGPQPDKAKPGAASEADTAILEGLNKLALALALALGGAAQAPKKGYHDYTPEELEEMEARSPEKFEQLINNYTPLRNYANSEPLTTSIFQGSGAVAFPG